MKTKISKSSLKLGMTVVGFEGPWIDHPFWKKKVLLKDQKTLDLILVSRIDVVWIECDAKLENKEKTHLASASEVQTDEASSNQKSNVENPTTATGRSRKTKGAKLNDKAAVKARAKRVCSVAADHAQELIESARLGKILTRESTVEVVREIQSSIDEDSNAISSFARLKNHDNYTFFHSVAVCALMVGFGKHQRMETKQCTALGVAGMFHDIGKAFIPQDLLNKPGALSDEEFKLVKTHPGAGYKFLSENGGFDRITLDVVLHHHEKINGTGYPRKLTELELSVPAKMSAICDVYDAISSKRPYKEAWDPSTCLKKMMSWKGHFDKMLMKGFIESLGVFPVGSLVRLKSNKLALVIESNIKNPAKPRVKTFFSVKSQVMLPREYLDLAKPSCTDAIVRAEDRDDWNFKDLDDMWIHFP